jgi:hypothetical protein
MAREGITTMLYLLSFFDDKTDDNTDEQSHPETYASLGWETTTTAGKLNVGTREFPSPKSTNNLLRKAATTVAPNSRKSACP